MLNKKKTIKVDKCKHKNTHTHGLQTYTNETKKEIIVLSVISYFLLMRERERERERDEELRESRNNQVNII